MYGSVFASTSAPWSTRCGSIPYVMSMISAWGAIRFITPWHVPTKSSCSPKSLRNVMNTFPTLPTGDSRDGGDETVEVVRLGLREHAYPMALGDIGGLGPDRDGGDPSSELSER